MNYDLQRFIVAHERDYATALEEIKEFDKLLDKFFDVYRDDRTIDFALNEH